MFVSHLKLNQIELSVSVNEQKMLGHSQEATPNKRTLEDVNDATASLAPSLKTEETKLGHLLHLMLRRCKRVMLVTHPASLARPVP